MDLAVHLFQTVLQKDRLSSSVRLLFARLQVLVMREAIANPRGFTDDIHPARTLVALMDSCTVGIEGAMVSGADLENEIERVVLFIEQSNPVGRAVFEQAYLDFQSFLSGFRTPHASPPDKSGAVFKKEQREAYAIEYTLLIRDMLKGLTIDSKVKDFLFSVWADVLALAALSHGPHHANTMALQKVVNDLIWNSGAKTTRRSRSRVINDVSLLLKQLHAGMTLLGLSVDQQKIHIDSISPPMVDAFMSPGASPKSDTPIPPTPVSKPPVQTHTVPGTCAVHDLDTNGLEVTEQVESSVSVWSLFDEVTDKPANTPSDTEKPLLPNAKFVWPT